MKKLYTLLLVLLIFTTTNANTKKADRLFDRWEYFRAAQLYEKEAKKNPSADVYFKLGECYRKMNSYKNLEQAADDKVNAYGTYSDPIFYLHYGQVLKNNGKNDEAKIAFDKYAQLVPGDPRGKFYSESIDIVKEDRQWDLPIQIKNVGSLNTPDADFSPVMYKDGVVFATTRKTAKHSKIYSWTGNHYLDLYYAKRTNDELQFQNIEPFGGNINSKKYHDGPACFSKNFDTIYVSRVDKTLEGEEKKTLEIERNAIFVSTLKDGEWTKAKAFPYNNDTFSVANPFLSTDGSKLYFVSDMPNGFGESDIYYCNKSGDSWSAPVNMGPNINTFGSEKFPMTDSAGNFYFSSNGYQGFGGMDICVSINNAKAIPLKYPINSLDDDYGILFTKEGKAGYISSNRVAGSKGDADMFFFDFTKDALDEKVVTSIYTIGYRSGIIPVPVVVVPVRVPGVFNTSPLLHHFIYFDFDKAELRHGAQMYLDSLATYMQNNPNTTLIMGGHCDERGTAGYNMRLSVKRVNNTKQYLLSKGIRKGRINATGYGLERMVNKCEPGVYCTEQEHQLNRRVEFYFQDYNTKRND